MMNKIRPSEYSDLLKLTVPPKEIYLADHLNGFDIDLNNSILQHLNNISNNTCTVIWSQILSAQLKSKYPNLQFKQKFPDWLWPQFQDYKKHPPIKINNFICSFNGSPHVSRKLLVAALKKFDYFNPNYCSKNFAYSRDVLDGHIQDYVGDKNMFYRKFFISEDSDIFFQTIYSFGHDRFRHNKNIYNLENQLTQSFLHIVSETMATSYYPFLTEKMVYSIVTRGLFLAYAQPGWHSCIEKYGFKKYDKLFNYTFDSIINPVERLVELMTMVGKFKNLSEAEWQDLYLMELDTIEYNYDHFFSGRYLEHLKQYNN